jgi:hypothetical protein
MKLLAERLHQSSPVRLWDDLVALFSLATLGAVIVSLFAG